MCVLCVGESQVAVLHELVAVDAVTAMPAVRGGCARYTTRDGNSAGRGA